MSLVGLWLKALSCDWNTPIKRWIVLHKQAARSYIHRYTTSDHLPTSLPTVALVAVRAFNAFLVYVAVTARVRVLYGGDCRVPP